MPVLASQPAQEANSAPLAPRGNIDGVRVIRRSGAAYLGSCWLSVLSNAFLSPGSDPCGAVNPPQIILWFVPVIAIAFELIAILLSRCKLPVPGLFDGCNQHARQLLRLAQVRNSALHTTGGDVVRIPSKRNVPKAAQAPGTVSARAN